MNPLYQVIDLDKNHPLIVKSTTLVNEFLEQNKMKDNVWNRIEVTNEPRVNCFGKPYTFVHDIDSMCIEASQLLNDYEFNVEMNENVNVELHYTNAETKKMHSHLAVHKDNDISRYADLHVLIIYVKVECEGGELNIYDRGYDLVNTIPIKVDDPYIRCVLLDGNCYHQPQPIVSGKRFAVSFQLDRKK